VKHGRHLPKVVRKTRLGARIAGEAR
jgi:hypothetical protein